MNQNDETSNGDPRQKPAKDPKVDPGKNLPGDLSIDPEYFINRKPVFPPPWDLPPQDKSKKPKLPNF